MQIESVYPSLSLKERDRRWNEVRKMMKGESLDCLVVWAGSGLFDMQSYSLRYLSQIGGNGVQGYAVFPIDGAPTVWLRDGHLAAFWKHVQQWVEDIRGIETASEQIATRLAELGCNEGKIGLVGYRQTTEDDTPPHGFYTNLTKLLPKGQFVNVQRAFDALRAIKSEEELGFLERAAVVGDEAFAALKETARPGVTEKEVYGSMLSRMLKSGGEIPTLFLWGSHGERSGLVYPHAGQMPTMRRFERGDIIKVEMHPRYGGYMTHEERSANLKPLSDFYKQMSEVNVEAFRKGFAKLKPNGSTLEVVETMHEVVSEAGFAHFELHVHGHGLESGDVPSTGMVMFRKPGADYEEWKKLWRPVVLKPQMVAALILDTATSDFRTGLQLASTFVITDSGARLLSRTPLDIIQV